MSLLSKILIMFSFIIVHNAFAQVRPGGTMRAGSGGSAGTTQQGPVYDAGIVGPNAAMGGPDVTAVDPEGEVRQRKNKKKPVGTIRVDAKGSTNSEELPLDKTTTK